MTKITDILETMEYGPAPEDASIVREWLNDHSDGFGHFIDGEFTKPGSGFAVSDPATGKPIANVTQGTAEDVSAAVDFLGLQPNVDRERIGALGVCGSGSFVISAAKIDPRMKAIATVRVTPWTRLGSLFVTPFRISIPMPLMVKMISMMTAPPSR